MALKITHSEQPISVVVYSDGTARRDQKAKMLTWNIEIATFWYADNYNHAL